MAKKASKNLWALWAAGLVLLAAVCTMATWSSSPASAPASAAAKKRDPAVSAVDSKGAPVEPMRFETTPMTIKGKVFTMEVAVSTEQEARGLMYRKSMPADHGMLFVMPESKPQSFWMHETWIPLDIVFLDAAGKVIEVEARKAMDETGMGPSVPTLYVIELNLGEADKIGLKPGDKVEIPKKYVKN